jgi:hypothetical protein
MVKVVYERFSPRCGRLAARRLGRMGIAGSRCPPGPSGRPLVLNMTLQGSGALMDRVLGGEAVGMKHRRSCSGTKLSSAFAGYRFPPDVILLAVLGICASRCRTETSRSSWLNAGSRSTTSACTGGCSTSLHPSWTPLDPAGIRWVAAGSSMRPTSRSPGSGAPVPGRRPERSCNRCLCLATPRYRCGTNILPWRTRRERGTGGGRDRPGSGTPPCHHRADTGRRSQHPAVRKQQGRVRLWATQSQAAAHARTENRPDRHSHHRRSRGFMQKLLRGHYELGVDARNHHLRIAAAFDKLAQAI